ncbi:MAG: hypothetical protein VKP57_12200 [Candidatus Sericytochromatia bacterium]|nr:hypothetical protein [Candidatus Sericytochromatia bacterium]
MNLSGRLALDERTLWLLGGISVAVWAGGWWMERSFRSEGGTGSLAETMPIAVRQVAAWSPRAILVGIEGRDLVRGRSGDKGGWVYTFMEAGQIIRTCEVRMGKHHFRVWQDRGQPAPALPAQGLLDSAQLATDLVARGVPGTQSATWSWRVSEGHPLLTVATAGRLAATWSVDPGTGQLLDFQSSRVP